MFQVNISREKVTKDLNMFQLTKIKMEIGCWSAMFHGSKFNFVLKKLKFCLNI